MTRYLLAVFVMLFPHFSFAGELNGATLSLYWGIPFVGILLSIALCPLCLPNLWHHHFGKIIWVWVLLFVIPFAHHFGLLLLVYTISHSILEEFIPFILLLLALFTVSGGILIKGNLQGTPKLNVTLLAIGTLLASIMGTTGAAMLLIRPLIRANDQRRHQVHVVIFFIFLVANIGGGLTPLGDPPLFIGFLKGVDFFWTVGHMLLPVFISSAILLILFYAIDSYYYRREDNISVEDPTPTDNRLQLKGKINLLLLVAIIGCVLLSGFWQSSLELKVLGATLSLSNLVRDLLLFAITLISLCVTSKSIRVENQFNWEPILEVAKLFVGIFITIVPVLAILRAGQQGDLASITELVTDHHGEPINLMYFWLTGLLSGFLDNAPTYLVFFNLAAGDAGLLMTELAKTLLAISMGSVFMGALTYIGNAPNFMIKSIATQHHIVMPGFFGYMKWSFSILLPVFILLALIFF
ncbi:sodium:proton antiporter [Utexia brackfieldae]|uniref:sodium:proton antiporter n=1 Tax=Utexia brackfieldae TaxID=3074108 RepID=UPI00370D3390